MFLFVLKVCFTESLLSKAESGIAELETEMNRKLEYAKAAADELEVQEKVSRKMKKIFQGSLNKNLEEMNQINGNSSLNLVNNEILILISQNHDHFKERDNLIGSLLNELKNKLDQQSSLKSNRNIFTRNNTSIFEIISALNSSIALQKSILSSKNEKIHESFGKIKNNNDHHYVKILKGAMEDLEEIVIVKYEVVRTKYSEIEDFLSRLKNFKRNSEEIAQKISEIEDSKNKQTFDEEIIVQNEDSMVKKYQEVISKQLREFQSSIKIKDDEINILDDKYRQCITKARDCKCFYSSWFNKKCKF